MGTITLNDKQQRRAEVLSRTQSGALSRQQACELLDITDRQLRRLLARFKAEGLASVVHGNTGRPPTNKVTEGVRTRLAELAGPSGAYVDFNACHLAELLAEREGIAIGRSTLDRLLCEAGVRKRRRGRPRRVFGRRERRAREGEMLLIDGSPHDWLEGRDPLHKKLCLLGAVDDATGKAVHLRFWPTECQAGYLTLAREVTLGHGVPESFYHDRHTILVSPKGQTVEDELAGREPMSQFQAVLAQLGAEGIRALTPQAKGRIERMWQTLQGRLTKEMRLAGVKSLAEANAFLPGYVERYNGRFGVEARDGQPAWVKPEASDLDLPYLFAAREERVVRADHTLSYAGQVYQIARKRRERSLAGERVQVHTTPEGERFFYHGKTRLAARQIAERPAPKAAPLVAVAASPQRPAKARPSGQSRKNSMAYLHAGVKAGTSAGVTG